MKILKPLLVPWMIAPSLPRLTLISEEDGENSVRFRGFFGFEGAGNTRQDSILVDNAALAVNKNEPSARYQLISVKFEMLGWLRRSPQISDREVICESDYDWSNVPGVIRDGEGVTEWRTRFAREWRETRICPNPGAYIVGNSDWEVGPPKAKFNLNHFLILGDACSVEILAKNQTWTSEGNTKE